MSRWLWLPLLLTGCTGTGSHQKPAPAALPTAHPILAGGSAGGPILIELFTSQGCSSCPPADRLLSLIGHDPGAADKVIALGYHVDYWNYIGWSDPFSAAAWTARQKAYQGAFGSTRMYTPELVVNGAHDTVGSDGDAVGQLMDAAQAEGARAGLTVTAQRSGNQVTAHIAATPTGGLPGKLSIMAALYENGIATKILRGENKGETLINDYIVRRLDEAFALAGSQRAGDVTFTLDPAWGKDLGVAVFAQDPATMRIYGAAATAAR